MNAEQNAAYVISQSVCAMIEAMGMAAFNQHRLSLGQSIGYDEDAFNKLIEKYGIHHNAVCSVMEER